MIDEKVLRAIELLGLQAAENPTDEDVYDNICRWFSTTFSTSLPEVEALDQIYVLKHYFADKYIQLYGSSDTASIAAYDKLRRQILNPGSENEMKESDDEWIKKLENEVAAAKKKPNVDDTIKEKIAESMSEVAESAIKEAMSKLNLLDYKDIPDSGSFGE